MNDSMNQRWLRWSLTAVVVLLGLIAIELSAVVGPLGSSAYAQVPDSGLQRKQLLDGQVRMNNELAKANNTLNQIRQILQERTIKVKVVGTDKELRKRSDKEVKKRSLRTPSTDRK